MRFSLLIYLSLLLSPALSQEWREAAEATINELETIIKDYDDCQEAAKKRAERAMNYRAVNPRVQRVTVIQWDGDKWVEKDTLMTKQQIDKETLEKYRDWNREDLDLNDYIKRHSIPVE